MARWGDSASDRRALDNWITREQDDLDDRFREYDPVCICGLKLTDHPQVQRTDEDGNDYETYTCGPNTVPPATLVSDIPNGQGGPQ